MKLIIAMLLGVSNLFAQEPVKAVKRPVIKTPAVEKALKKKKPNAAPEKLPQKDLPKEKPSPSVEVNKVPKALFLIKRAKVDADVGEPILYPFDRQARTMFYEVKLDALPSFD